MTRNFKKDYYVASISSHSREFENNEKTRIKSANIACRTMRGQLYWNISTRLSSEGKAGYSITLSLSLRVVLCLSLRCITSFFHTYVFLSDVLCLSLSRIMFRFSDRTRLLLYIKSIWKCNSVGLHMYAPKYGTCINWTCSRFRDEKK